MTYWPVINTGTNTGCPAQDQRGYNRDGSCDKGAYEYGASAPPPPSTTPITTTYYYAGAQLIALREITATLYFVHTDHLGSVSAVTSAAGALAARQYFYRYGGARPAVLVRFSVSVVG